MRSISCSREIGKQEPANVPRVSYQARVQSLFSAPGMDHEVRWSFTWYGSLLNTIYLLHRCCGRPDLSTYSMIRTSCWKSRCRFLCICQAEHLWFISWLFPSYWEDCYHWISLANLPLKSRVMRILPLRTWTVMNSLGIRHVIRSTISPYTCSLIVGH